jgi:hypothetical protein
MSISISQINVSPTGDSFTILYQRFNQIANAMSTQVITTAANTVGAPTTGNTQLSGIFGSTVIATPTLRGGNVSTSDVLGISSNVLVFGDVFTVGNSTVNTTINSSSFTVNTAVISNLTVANLSLTDHVSIGAYLDSYFTSSTTNASAKVVDSFDFTVYRSAEYFLQIKDNNSGDYQVSKILVTSDGVDAYMTEYGMVTSNSLVGLFSASANSTQVLLTFMPSSSTSCTIKGNRKAMGI